MNRLAVLFGAAALLTSGQAFAAQCTDAGQVKSPDDMVAACTAEIQRLLGAREELATYYVVRSKAFLAQGDKTRALADLNQALETYPRFWGALINRAVYYTNEGRLDLALKDYDDAIQFGADTPEAYLYRGYAYAKKGDLDRALADAGEAVRRDPKYLEAHLFLMDHDLEAGKADASIAEATTALSLGAKPDRALNGRCWSRAVANLEPRLGLADCDQALRLSPNNPSYLDSRGLVDLRLADFDSAIRDYSAALAADPRKPDSLYGRSLARRQRGDASGADADAAAAAALDPRIAERFAAWGLKP